MYHFGRQKIMTDEAVITRENIIEVLTDALLTHHENAEDIDYLWNYYKGKQPILTREKAVRPEICNKVVENHAEEIVDFKVGYLLGEPIQYVARVDGDGTADDITKLNSYALSESKEANDVEIAEWAHATGIGCRMILPDSEYSEESDEAPFEDFVLDPRSAFIVYHNGLGNPPVMGVKYIKKKNGDILYSCYTQDAYYEILADSTDGDAMSVTKETANSALGIPIIEYPLNNTRRGAFEPVITMLNAINTVESNRLDGVEQFVQALMLFHNVDISDEDYDDLREKGAIKVFDKQPDMKGDVKYLIEQLDQSQTQTLKNDLYDTVLVITGMPNRNGGSSTSDTGSAVIMRDGWSAAETRAKKTAAIWKKSEKEWLKKAIKICTDLSDLTLKIGAIEIRFTRWNYENIAQKATVLTEMLGCTKIDPLLAFAHCGLFADPEQAYKMSMKYAEEQERKAMQSVQQQQQQTGNDPAGGGSGKPNPPKRKESGGSRP